MDADQVVDVAFLTPMGGTVRAYEGGTRRGFRQMQIDFAENPGVLCADRRPRRFRGDIYRRSTRGRAEDHQERLRHRDCGSATRGVGMRKFVLQSMSVVIGIGLLGTTQALADPVTVTSGHVTARLTGGTFTLTGDGFSLTGAASYESGLWECTPCRASDRLNLSLSSSAGGSFDSGLEGEFDHVHYDATWLAGHLAFTAPDMTSAILGAGHTSISMPFTFSGELANYESFKSRANGSLPLFIATFTGSGIATAQFQGPVADPDGALFFADRISYDFAPGAPSPTPEPASLLLLGTGAAGLLARRRVRRNLKG